MGEHIDTTMAKDLPKPTLSPDMDTMAMDMADMVAILDMVDMGATLVDTLVDTDTTMARDLPMLMPSLDTMAMEDMVATGDMSVMVDMADTADTVDTEDTEVTDIMDEYVGN